MSGNEILESPCLGKPFQLGMLYDCSNDCLVPERTLWDVDILNNALVSRPSAQSQFEVFTNDTLDAKMEMAGADANFKMSILSGLADVPKYVNFFEDRVTTKQQARVTMKWERISKFEELDLDLLRRVPLQIGDEEKSATHFVSGVSYGSNTFFVFDREVRRNESHANVSSDMKLLISCLPSFNEIPEMDKDEAKKLTCTVYGDTPLSAGSSISFEEAVKTIGEQGKNHEPVIPLKAFLQPLSSLDIEAAICLNEVNLGTISQVQSNIEDFSDLNTRVTVLTKTKAFSNFSNVQKKLCKFKEMISHYINNLKKDLARLLRRVRRGDAEEDELVKLLEGTAETPFRQAYLSSWVEKTEQEVNLLSMYLDYFKEIQFVFDPDELDSVINSLEYDKVVCFSFTIDDFEDNHLHEMYSYLHTGNWNREPPDESTWCKDEALINDFETQARNFSRLAKATYEDNTKFLVTSICNGSKGGRIAVIQMFQDGRPTEFEPGEIPLKQSNINDNSGSAKTFKQNNKSVCATTASVNSGETAERESEPEETTQMQHENSDHNQKLSTSETPSVTFHPSPRQQVVPESEDGSQSSKISQIKEDSFCGNSSPKETLRHEKETGSSTFHNVPSDEQACLSNDGLLPTTYTRDVKKQDVSSPCRLAERVYHKSEEIETGNDEFVSVYKPPMDETMRLDGKMILKKCLNVEQDKEREKRKEKVLLVVGATGAGKSTLINGMVNYIMGVEWKDEFRFKIVTEQVSSQANSVTKEITAYSIHPMEGSAIPYVFTIVDTPGFGDTEGLSRDIFITNQIKEFFSLEPPNGIDHLDGIGFVTQSSLPRLTPTQKYIFDSILSIFGKDVENNFFIMITFADGKNPPVLEAIEKAQIAYDSFFKFNNSALFADNAKSGFDEMFWQMGHQSFKDFFAKFSATNSVSLQLTNEVLKEREQLETLIEGLNPQIKWGLGKIEEMRQEKRVLEQHEADIEQNKKFEYFVPVMKAEQTDLTGTGRHTTHCLKCNSTCHKDCKIADDSDKKRCIAMDTDGNCKVCTGKCPWDSHKNVPYIIEYTTVKEKRTSQDLKMKYNLAVSGKAIVQDMLSELENGLHELRIKVLSDMYKVWESLRRLDEIALRPNPLTEVQYIELLIETEKRECRPGFKDRVKAFEDVKKKAKLFTKIKSKDDIPKLLDELIPMEERRSTSKDQENKFFKFRDLGCTMQ